MSIAVNDIHSELNRSEVAEVFPVDSLEKIRSGITRARALGVPVAVAGGRYAMGGQQFRQGAVLLDTRRLNRVRRFDAARGLVEVEAGIQWPELIDRLEPAFTGWFGREDIFAFDPKRLDWAPTANRFEMATPPVVDAYVARAGLGLIREIGCEAIREWTDSLSQRLIDGGLARGLEIYGTTDVACKTATTAFVCPGNADVIEKRLLERRIHAAARGRVIRLAPHYYNSTEDIEAGLDALADLLGSR